MNMVVKLAVFPDLGDNNVSAWVSDVGRRQIPFELPSVTFGC